MLELMSKQLVQFMRDGDTIVDFSCGANDWVPIMKLSCAEHGMRCSGKAFDIITAKNVEDFQLKSWFDVQALGVLPFKFAVGLWPPYILQLQVALVGILFTQTSVSDFMSNFGCIHPLL